MKRTIIKVFIIIASACLTACSNPGGNKRTSSFDGAFDTLTTVTCYEKNSGDFEKIYSAIQDEMERLHKLYDIYNEYSGINNLKTINDNAGIKPVKADKDLIALIEFGIKAYDDTDGNVNIALGSVLKIWREYRENALETPEKAAVPPFEELRLAAEHTNIKNIVIDKDAGTVFLADKQMSLDAGAIAKGFAVELAGEKARETGFVSGIINAGGNVYTSGISAGTSKKWEVGVQNPFAAEDGKQLFDVISANDCSIVSSGDYQRFFIAEGQSYNHIINPETLMPSDKYSGVTVVHAHSGIADMLSTALFIMPQEEGQRLAESFGAEAFWIFKDKTYTATESYKKISRLYR